MRLNVEFSASVSRTDLDDYIRPLEVAVLCTDEQGLEEYTVGRLALDQVLWMAAQIERVSLFEICDSDSQGLHEVHTILTRGRQEFRRDLRIDGVTDHVLFLHTAVIHPSFHAYRQGILDAVFRLFGEQSLAVMWRDTSGLTDAELSELGFCLVAGAELVFRHSSLRTRFSDRYPRGQPADDAVATPECEEWVLGEWRQLSGDAEPEEGDMT